MASSSFSRFPSKVIAMEANGKSGSGRTDMKVCNPPYCIRDVTQAFDVADVFNRVTLLYTLSRYGFITAPMNNDTAKESCRIIQFTVCTSLAA